MISRGFALAALAAMTIAAGAVLRSPDAGADPEIVGYPDSIAALGDSITRAANTTGLGDHPEESWATGTSELVNSLYSRLLAVNPAISGNRYNDAVSGARMTDLNGQALNAVSQGAELVTILMGANDVCTSSEATMTPIATFQAQFETAMTTLSSGLPDSRIAVASIPDVYNLWDILHDDFNAQFVWNLADICQSLLENPTSMAPADVQRRANVRQRNIDFNNVLQDVCAQYVHCRFDDFAAFNTQFTPQEVSSLDYFHPSIEGQALAASLGWGVYDLTDMTAPASSSAGTFAAGSATVTLSATDNAAVSGIEYETGGAWQRYTGPLLLPSGTVVTWRAVDVNGNVEATSTCRIETWGWPAGDNDCDGWPSAAGAPGKAPESFIGTDPAAHCAATGAANDEPLPDAWPVDFDDNQFVDGADVLKFGIPFLSMAPGPPYAARFDFNGDGFVNGADVLQFGAYFLKRCEPLP